MKNSCGWLGSVAGVVLGLAPLAGLAQWGPDVYEPDNTSGQAKTINRNETQNRTIHNPGDVDWAKFLVTGGTAQNVVIETGGGGDDTELWLYREAAVGGKLAGDQLAYDDNSGPNAYSRIRVASLPPGTYYIKVAEKGNDQAIAAYTLKASWTYPPPPPVDAYEPDDAPLRAKWAANGQTQRRTIHAAGNEDWAKIKITGNGAARLVVETAGAEGDTQLVLYAADLSGNQNGLRLGYDDDSGTGSFSRIVKTRVYPGIYYIRVLEFGNDWTIPAYTLKASWTPLAAPRADGYENDNLSTRAKEIRRNQTQRRSIHVRGDVDWVKFRVDGVGAMNFAAETHGVSGDTYMRLYQERAGGGVGTRLAANDNGGFGSFSRIAIRGPLLPGTYYLKIEERGNDRVIPGYMLTVNWTRIDAF